MRPLSAAAGLVLLLAGGAAGQVHAENLKGRWQIGGGLSFVSTQDDIRNNSAFVIFVQPGPDGVPGSGDETIVGQDIRNDDLIARETTIQEGIRLDLNFSYGFTNWFSLQIDTGYYDANVVQLDTFVQQTVLADFNRDGLLGVNETDVFLQSQPVTAGTVTQVPLTVSGVFRFVPDSPINPYLGLGAGYVFVDAQPSADLRAIDDNLQLVDDTTGISIKQVLPDQAYIICQGQTCDPYSGINLEAHGTTQWHVMAGFEYFINSKLSVYFDARYNFISQAAQVDVDGNDQVLFTYTSQGDTLPYCDDPQFDDRGFIFDRSSFGFPGVCRPGNNTRFNDQLLVQGGSIDMTAFNIGLGVRWAF